MGLRGVPTLLRPKRLDMIYVPVPILLYRPEGQGSSHQWGLWPLLAQTPNLASKTLVWDRSGPLVPKLRKFQPQL